MPEISGKIVFKAPDESVASCLDQLSEETSSDVLASLFEATDLNANQLGFSLESDLEEGYLVSDSVTHSGQYTIIEPFGDEWLKVLEALQRGKGLEFWAHIQHEHGVEYFIALTATQSFSKTVDLEEGELEDEEIDEIEQAWLATVPADLQTHFGEESQID